MTLTLLAMLALGAFGGCTVGFIGAMGLGQFETWPLTVGICAGVVLALVGWWLIWRKRP